MKYGFEREFFVTKADAKEIFVAADFLPHDECGYLAEARGQHDSDPVQAAYNLLVAEERLREHASKNGLSLQLLATVKLPDAFRVQCLRTFGKNPITSELGSYYGKFYAAKDNLARAALHVHFSDEREVHWTAAHTDRNCSHVTNTEYKISVPQIIDMPRFIFGLDKIFSQEIKEAKRLPGLYEMKPYGFEYRSLPATVDVVVVAYAVKRLQQERWKAATA